MAKKTLLQIVQKILNDIDGDEVNSIDDTIESSQVASIVEYTYEAMMSRRNWPHTRKLIEIQASGNLNLPTHMTLQENIKEISSVYYNKAKLMHGDRRINEEVLYLEPDDFLRLIGKRDNTQANYMTVIDPSSQTKMTIRTDTAPTYFTSFDDEVLIFDSYDNQVDDTLQTSKIQVYAYTMPEWVRSDDAIPNLPMSAFSALIEEATSSAAVKVRQQPDQKAEQESQRQNKWLARNDRKVGGGIKFPNYGRSRGRSNYNRDPTFRRD
jgi:hypothetical protein